MVLCDPVYLVLMRSKTSPTTIMKVQETIRMNVSMCTKYVSVPFVVIGCDVVVILEEIWECRHVEQITFTGKIPTDKS